MDLRTLFLTLAVEEGPVEAILAPGRSSLRFADLVRRIEQVRDELAGLGIGHGDRVAMVLPRGPETAVCSVAVAACATCVPLNPEYTEVELERHLRKLAPRAIILAGEGAERSRRVAAGLGISAIDLVTAVDAPAGTFRLEGERVLHRVQRPWASADDTAFILLTSGTTSREKLVPLTLRQILVLAQATRDRFALGPRDRCLHAVPMFHANGLLTALISPLAAGCGVICPTGADVPSMFAAMDALQPTWFPVGYTVHLALLDRLDADGGRRETETYRDIARRTKLRFTLSSAGSLDPEALRRLEDVFDAPVVERYATSETGMLTANPLPPGIRKPRTLGTPLCNEIRILDNAGAPARRLEDGEIVVRGPSVFGGYLDDPEANRAAFTDGWFRTGDLGHFDDDGYLVVTGRIKELISRGGEKISPLEVERILAAHPSVARACVFGIPHPTLGEEVVAAVVPTRPGPSNAEELLGFAHERLASFKVPRRIFFVSALPLAATNKVDRRAVAESCRASMAAEPTSATDVPGSAIEGALSGLWGTVLKRAVGRRDNFFLLGGDSLRGQELVAHVSQLFGVDVPVTALFDEAGTVSGMARMIEAARKGGERPAAVVDRPSAGIPCRSTPAPVVLSPPQTRAWFLARFEPGDPAYNQPHAYRLEGPLDVAALHAGLQMVADRHDVMRTTYAQIGDEPRQIVRERAPVELRRLDLSAVPEGVREQALMDALTAEGRRPFDLETDLPVRFTLITLGAGRHAFLSAWHHIAHDGWSEGVFLRELSTAYNASRSGRPAALPPLALQYADYAMWQRDRLESPAAAGQLRYWREHLAGLAPLDLATDYPRPRVQGFTGDLVHVVLPATLIGAVKALARAEGATLFMALLAGFQVLLHRLSGATDVAVGVPIAGRARVELEHLIGFFANTLVLRTDLSREPTFRELLARVRRGALSAYANQDVPFEKLVEVLAPPRDPSRNPLFQVALAMLNMAPPELALDGLVASRLSLPIGTSKFDFHVTLREADGVVHTSWTYCTDLFERATIEAMARRFAALLEAIVTAPDQRIGQLAVLDADERDRLLAVSTGPAASAATEDLTTLFEAQAGATPDAVALTYEDAPVTYRELVERSGRLARVLRGRGVEPGTRVGVCLERSPELIVSLVAVLEAGGVYVPLDPSAPRARLALIVEDAAIAVVLTTEGLAASLPGSVPRVLVENAEAGSAPAAGRATRSARAEDLACILYTSGSSGRPKGVAIRRDSVVRLVKDTNYVALSPADTVAHASNVAFDAATFEIWGALLNGARLAILPSAVLLSPPALAGELRRLRVTCAFLTTAVFHLMSEHAPEAFRGLRYLLFGGETCDPERVRAVLEAGGPEHLVHVYGPTEATTFATHHLVRHVESRRPVPIGRPIAGAEVLVIDAHGGLAPHGVVGEICIGGSGVAAGYVGGEPEGESRFGPHPIRPDGGRVYRTGDLGRWRNDGELEFVGRADAQVKIRGFRVEPAEVSAALGEHPSVAQSTVTARRADTGDVRLTAYFTSRDDNGPPPAADLRRFLALRVPEYMIPTAFVHLPDLPLTANGKVDQDALPTPDPSRLSAAHTPPPVPDATERALCLIWAEVLGLEAVEVDDDFFALGGHSLMAFGVIARVQRVLGSELPVSAIFEAPTLRALAARLRDTAGSTPAGGGEG
jgi:amino acid adenylation domain-containing protein